MYSQINTVNTKQCGMCITNYRSLFVLFIIQHKNKIWLTHKYTKLIG